MKLIIDEKACKKHKMTVLEVLYTLAIKTGLTGNDVQEMLSKEILVEGQDSWYMVTQHWSDTLDEILADSASTGERTDEELMELAKKMRELYPEGRMVDKKTGQLTSYYFRCNKAEVVKKLKTFFSRYGNYSDEDILDATKRYVDSFSGNYQQRGFRLLKYFIFKDDVKQGPDGNYIESLSPLLDFLENNGDENMEIITGEWLSNSRN